ncbi:MAG: hypothetical protein QXH20_00365 [Candidatus Bathyarchaeia archaeon]
MSTPQNKPDLKPLIDTAKKLEDAIKKLPPPQLPEIQPPKSPSTRPATRR